MSFVERAGEATARPPEDGRSSGAPPRARPLFVSGCDRSGTTAFADYLNRHPRVMVCQERYKALPHRVTWDHFSFERIMDFRPEETKRPQYGDLEGFIRRHSELVTGKDPAKLRWVGDKGPFYVKYMKRLAGSTPGARFIILHRPIEEVAESWEARARDPGDQWRAERGIEEAVRTWNLAMRKTREFVESSPAPRVLIVGYHDFFYRNETVAPQVSRFLGLEFDETLTGAWREAARRFEGGRRRKEGLGEEQLRYVREHADRAAEAWILDRIERQRVEPGLYVEESPEAGLSSLGGIEAEMWRCREEAEKLRRALTRERRRNRRLVRRLEEVRGARTWRLLSGLRHLWPGT